MSAQQTTTTRHMTRAQMDALVDGHYRAEETGDLEAIVDGFTSDAEHDVVGRPGDPLHGGDQIEGFYRALLAELRIDRFEPVRRWYGDDHVVDEGDTARNRKWPALRARRSRPAGAFAVPAHLRFQRRPDQPGKRVDRPRRDSAAALRLTSPFSDPFRPLRRPRGGLSGRSCCFSREGAATPAIGDSALDE